MIFVTGDTHGDIERFNDPRLKNLRDGDTLIVCGDFGFLWDGSKREKKNRKALAKKKYNICFLDGTHENFDMLEEYPVTSWNGGEVQQIEGNLYHLMRGQIYRIEDTTFFAMGGGESPDLDIRLEENNWSSKETPTPQELMTGAENIEKCGCKVDVIVTHEPPGKIKSFLNLSEGVGTHLTTLNAYFDELNKTCRYGKWYFGSMHVDKFVSSNQIALYRNIVEAIDGRPVRK